MRRMKCVPGVALASWLCVSAVSTAGPAATLLPVAKMTHAAVGETPVSNSAFAPAGDAGDAPEFSGMLTISQSQMLTRPQIEQPLIEGRDARLFPQVSLEFFTAGQVLVPVQRGEMVRESGTVAHPSYWRVIPQFGRIWREKGDGSWSRAAFPLMLVNDTENHAHQGLATFLYRKGAVTALRFQFVQQTGPYLLKPHFVAWGVSGLVDTAASPADADARREKALQELRSRLPVRPWSELEREYGAGRLAGFGGPLRRKWLVAAALVRDGTLYYQDVATDFGPYPYPLEMRFGVRSVMKSVGAPLSLLRLAQVYGPYVLNLHIGDYVKGLDAKYLRVRFIDAANMASGFGGVGSLKTHPNDIFDGYLEGDYDGWYLAPTAAEKIRRIVAGYRPYPWEPGVVMRYRDQDYFLLGAALDAFLKSVRGPDADIWDMLKAEVFAPIGIAHAPAVRTREAADKEGLVWFNAGYYPSLDDLAKIALLYQNLGEHAGVQILNRDLTADLLAARGALLKKEDLSRGVPADESAERYLMGIHFRPYKGSRSGQLFQLPTLEGSGENEVILFPNRMISIRTASASGLPDGETATSPDSGDTASVVDHLHPF